MQLKKEVTMHQLNEYLIEYKELNSLNAYKPVAVGKYGIRLRENIYSKELAKDYSKNKIIRKGTLTVGMGSTQIDIGILSTDVIYSVSPAYHTYTISGIDYDYLRYCLQCRNQDMFLRYMKRGSRQGKSIDLKRWITYKIPVHSKSDQKEIVERLNKVKEVIEYRKKQLQQLDELVQGRFVEEFGDPVSNSYGFTEATLPQLGELGRGVSKHRPRNDPKLLNGEYPLIQTGDVAAADLYINDYTSTYSEFGLRQSKMWDKGTLCITIAANIAKTGILKFNACFPDSVVGFKANDKTNNIFIHYWFSFFQKILEMQAPESAQKNINLKVLSELKVIVPDKEKQDQFADFVQQIDKSKLYSKKQRKFLYCLRLAISSII